MAGSIVATTTSAKGRGLVRITADVTCAGGVATAVVVGQAWGRLVGILIDPTYGSGATLTATADILITDAVTGAPILSDLNVGASADYYRPTQVITDNAGVAVTAAATAVDVNRDIFVAGKIKLGIANATTTDTGRIVLLIDEGR